MQDTLQEEQTRPKGRNRPHRTLATASVIRLGLFGAIFILALNMPWVKQFVTNVDGSEPLVGIGYWVLAAMFTWFLAWNLLRNLAFERKGFRIGTQLALGLAWAAWIAWLTNDRMNASNAFDRLDVIVNVVVVGLFAVVLALPIVWYDRARQFFNEKLDFKRRSRS